MKKGDEQALVSGKKYPKTGIRNINAKKSTRITNSPLVFQILVA